MDLYAYSQIEDLDELAKKNGIEVPRLRGYRLMSQEEPYSADDIKCCIESMIRHVYDEAVTSEPRFHPESYCSIYGPCTDKLKKKYLIQETRTVQRQDGSDCSYRVTVGFHWEKLHGKARKRIKLAIKHAKKRVLKQLQVFNKYAGRDDVLFIHSRIGGWNWHDYGGTELEKQPWFLEKVDDYFDSTYCDIYAKLEP